MWEKSKLALGGLPSRAAEEMVRNKSPFGGRFSRTAEKFRLVRRRALRNDENWREKQIAPRRAALLSRRKRGKIVVR
ncbi:MAG: hypothetical protein ACK4I8_01740 [Armatimonadota bacterium]